MPASFSNPLQRFLRNVPFLVNLLWLVTSTKITVNTTAVLIGEIGMF